MKTAAGMFLASKQMIFGENKKLVPASTSTSNIINNNHQYQNFNPNNNRNSELAAKYPGFSVEGTANSASLQNQLVSQYQQPHEDKTTVL